MKQSDDVIYVKSKVTGETVAIHLPTPPPMRVVTKGWFTTTEELVPLAILQQREPKV